MADNDEPMEKKRGVAAEESKALDGLTDQVCLLPPTHLPHTNAPGSL